MNEVAEIKEEKIPLSALEDRLKEIPMTAESISAEFKAIDNANDAVLDSLEKKYDDWQKTIWRICDVIGSMRTQVRVSRERNEIFK